MAGRNTDGQGRLGEGVVVPIVTPLTEGETVDSVGLRKVIEYVLAGGVHGIFVMGSTGEFARLGEKEWERAVDLTVEATAGRVPVYAGVTAPGAKQSLIRAHRAKEAGVDAIVLSPGYYFSFNQRDIEAVYGAASERGVPVLAYNIPIYTHVTIAPETFRRLLEAKAVIGIKDSSGDASLIRQYLDVAKSFPGSSVLVGSESIMRQGFAAGASGSVPSLANLFPLLLVEIYANAQRQEWARVEELCEIVNKINRLNALVDSSLGVVAWKKVALEEVGLCSARMTTPAPTYTPQEIERIKGVLAEYQAWMADGLPS